MGKKVKVDTRPKIKKIDIEKMKAGMQKQPELTEEQAYMQYLNNMISNAVLDMESTKKRTVDSIQALGQQLALYMNETRRLKEENEKLKNPKIKKK